MSSYQIHPMGNGLRTDHPIPDLPFVDDSHIPVADGHAVEAIGRHRGSGMWGRFDPTRDGGWVAFTTDPTRHDLGWLVRWHPKHGRSVVLYRNGDVSGMHGEYRDTAQLFRSGNYWWDGTTWYRPPQVFDYAGERFYRRPVPAAAMVSAGDLLQAGGSSKEGRILDIDQVDLDASYEGTWRDDLALWAAHRTGDQRAIGNCVVGLSAPELAADQLIGVTQMAQIAQVAASTLRAYISRGEGDVPQPQASVGGRNMWSHPVAEEWAERRHRSIDSVEASVARQVGAASMAPGIAELWEHFTRIFTASLWEFPDVRKRWALRWRTKNSVEEVAHNLGWDVAASLDRIISPGDLATTIRYAVLDELASGKDLHKNDTDPVFFGIITPIARMIDWLVRHHPRTAARMLREIIGDAERRLEVPRKVTEKSISIALSLDGTMDQDTRTKFLERVFSPAQAPD